MTTRPFFSRAPHHWRVGKNFDKLYIFLFVLLLVVCRHGGLAKKLNYVFASGLGFNHEYDEYDEFEKFFLQILLVVSNEVESKAFCTPHVGGSRAGFCFVKGS